MVGVGDLGGNLTTAPALNRQDPGVLNVWVRATDGDLAQRKRNGAAWTDWVPLGGGLVGAPAVVSRQANVVDMFVRGLNHAVYQKHWDGGTGWGAWTLLDPTPVDSTPAAVADAPGHIVLLARSGGAWRSRSGAPDRAGRPGPPWGPWPRPRRRHRRHRTGPRS